MDLNSKQASFFLEEKPYNFKLVLSLSLASSPGVGWYIRNNGFSIGEQVCEDNQPYWQKYWRMEGNVA